MNDDEIERLAERLRQPAQPGAEPVDEAIPMLTEIVDGPAGVEPGWPDASGPLPADAGTDEAPRTSQPHEPAALQPPARPGAGPSTDELVEQVLTRLLADPALLGEPVREAVDAATARFAEQLSVELHATVACALRDSLLPGIRAAVSEVLAESSRQPQRPL